MRIFKFGVHVVIAFTSVSGGWAQHHSCEGDPTPLIAAALEAGLQVGNVSSPEVVPGSRSCWVQFSYCSTSGWPYGRGIAAWRPSVSALEWLTTVNGDSAVHSVTWRDLNADSKPDLVFYSGEDEVLGTHIFVATSTDPLTLVLAYEHVNEYATLLDLDGDGKAEVLDSGLRGSTLCMECEPACRLPEERYAEVAGEYARVVGDFTDITYPFNVPFNVQTVESLFLFKPVRIFVLENEGTREATQQYEVHLRWRLSMLHSLRGASGLDCDEAIDDVLAYLEGRLLHSQR